MFGGVEGVSNDFSNYHHMMNNYHHMMNNYDRNHESYSDRIRALQLSASVRPLSGTSTDTES